MRTSLVAIPVLLAAAVAMAHGGATGIVKQRMDQMSSVSKAMKTIAAMIKGETEYDAETVRRMSGEIAAKGGNVLTDLFPKHSMDPPTEARVEIWSDWKNFRLQAFEMQTAALALSDGADNAGGRGDADSPFTLFGTLAGTCKACHDDFRIKK